MHVFRRTTFDGEESGANGITKVNAGYRPMDWNGKEGTDIWALSRKYVTVELLRPELVREAETAASRPLIERLNEAILGGGFAAGLALSAPSAGSGTHWDTWPFSLSISRCRPAPNDIATFPKSPSPRSEIVSESLSRSSRRPHKSSDRACPSYNEIVG